jgi:hypothetical protein
MPQKLMRRRLRRRDQYRKPALAPATSSTVRDTDALDLFMSQLLKAAAS